MEVEDIVILGGGLAGLAAALRCTAPVFEASSEAGGVAASDTVEGFTFDRGIHVLQTRSQRILELFADLGVEFAEHQRQAYIYSHGCFTAYPFQVNTAGLPLPTRVRCVWDFLTRSSDGAPANYEQWMYDNLGSGFAETFLIPYSEKFWTVPARELTCDWTGNRVPKPSVAQVLRGALWSKQTRIGANATFRYPVDAAGYGAVAEALTKRIGGVHTDHKAVDIDPRERIVTFANGRQVRYASLISTLPLPQLMDIVRGAPAELRAAAGKLRTNSIFVVNLGLDSVQNRDRHWVHFPEKDISFFRVSFPHNMNAALVPDGTSSISAEVAYAPDAPPDGEALTERVIDDLIRVGLLDGRESIMLRATRDIRLAYCIYDHQRKEVVRAAASWLEDNGIVTCGRYGLWSYFWSDEAMNSGTNAAVKALKLVDPAAAQVDEAWPAAHTATA